MLKVAIILAAVIGTYVILVRTSTAWVLNRFMLLGAGLGIAMFFLVSDIVRVAKHRGPGYVTYGEDDEDVEKVPESEYKRHHLFNDGFLLVFSLLAWIEGARRAASSELPPKRPNQAMQRTAGRSDA
jgi:hypothetical protein